jgi:hypothetical protein
MDYGYPERRKNKNDKRAKRKFNQYKKGGAQRSTNIKLENSKP